MDVHSGILTVTNVSEVTTQDHVVREFDVSFQSNVSVYLPSQSFVWNFLISLPFHGKVSGCLAYHSILWNFLAPFPFLTNVSVYLSCYSIICNCFALLSFQK